jgi:uncharacterized protein
MRDSLTLWSMTELASSDFFPDRLDVRAFAQAGVPLAGRTPLSKYERLTLDLIGQNDDFNQKTVQWSVQGELRPNPGASDAVWLHLRVQAALPMTCQRCLSSADIAVDIDQWFRFVADEKIALEQDETSEEDLLVISRAFDLHGLVEDELLMALPIVPAHDVCPTPVKLASTDSDFKAALTQKPNAFAALGSLKKTS